MLRRAENYLGRFVAWTCRCVCGAEDVIRGSMLRAGNSNSCMRCSVRSLTHGHTRGRLFTATYISWHAMLGRAANRSGSHPGYANVQCCEAWKSFEVFLSDMGKRPSSKHSLSRRLDTGNYEPRNVEWGTQAEQEAEKKGKAAMKRLHEYHNQMTLEQAA